MKTFSVTVWTIFLVLAFTTISSAQPGNVQEPGLGIKGGLNLSNFYSSEIDNQNIMLGFHVGLLYRMPLGDFFAIQPEVLFTQKGADFSDESIFANELSLKLNYIDIPVLGIIQLSEQFNIHLGPYVGFLIGDPSGTLNSNLIDANTNFSSSNFHRFDYGFSGGIGLSLSPIKLGIRYNLGLSEVGSENLLMGNSKNSVLQFYIGL